MKIRVGFGVDVHRLSAGIPLFIGGVEIPSIHGAEGHSDADVLIHAICDALLGAANLRDIGFHFSDQDPQYKGIDSKILLKEVRLLIEQKNYAIQNIDATIILEFPKLNPYISEIQNVLAEVLKIDSDLISIKATTHEGIDSFGSAKGIKAYATCLLLGK